jgi:hypothetical protein
MLRDEQHPSDRQRSLRKGVQHAVLGHDPRGN